MNDRFCRSQLIKFEKIKEASTMVNNMTKDSEIWDKKIRQRKKRIFKFVLDEL